MIVLQAGRRRTGSSDPSGMAGRLPRILPPLLNLGGGEVRIALDFDYQALRNTRQHRMARVEQDDFSIRHGIDFFASGR